MVDLNQIWKIIVGKIEDGLKKYSKEVKYRFHMPGHKGLIGLDPLKKILDYDVTEVDGTDNLMHPNEILKEFMDEMKDFYKSKKTYISVNGSTGGLMAAIDASCNRGDKILIQRDSHKSIYNAIEIRGLKPIYLMPEIDQKWSIPGAIDLKKLEEKLIEHEDIKSVVITHPNYYGMGQSIEKLVSIVHKYKKILIVDEAHGAHLPFIKTNGMISSIKAKADIVVQSMHKTLPALTQTALIHLNGDRVDQKKFEKKLFTYQTTSPSYILMLSMEFAFEWMKKNGEERLEQLRVLILEYSQKLERIPKCEAYKIDCTNENKEITSDFTKLIVSLNGYTGYELESILREKYAIQVEMADLKSVVLIITAVDEKESLEAFYVAMQDIDLKIELKSKELILKENIELKQEMSIESAFEAGNISVRLKESVGKIAADFIIPYPPGTPLVVPGELYTIQIVEYISSLVEAGARVLGIEEDYVSIVKH